MTDFITNNYIWLIVVLGVMLMACVGYFVEKKENKKETDEKVKVKKEKKSKKDDAKKQELEQDEDSLFDVIPGEEDKRFENTNPTEENINTIDEVKVEEIEQPLEKPEELQTTNEDKNLNDNISTELQGKTYKNLEEQILEDSDFKSNTIVFDEETPAVEQTIENERQRFNEIETFSNPDETESSSIFDSIQAPEENQQAEEETIENTAEGVKSEDYFNAFPTETPQEVTTKIDENSVSVAERTTEDTELPNNEDEMKIDRDFNELLTDTNEDLKIDLPPLEETTVEATEDDDEEELWKF